MKMQEARLLAMAIQQQYSGRIEATIDESHLCWAGHRDRQGEGYGLKLVLKSQRRSLSVFTKKDLFEILDAWEGILSGK